MLLGLILLIQEWLTWVLLLMLFDKFVVLFDFCKIQLMQILFFRCRTLMKFLVAGHFFIVILGKI